MQCSTMLLKPKSYGAEQYRLDQDRYRAAYQKIAASEEMAQMREEIAMRSAIEQIAREGHMSVEDAKAIYFLQQDRNQGMLASGNEGKAQRRW
jgi:hypothetical protein